MAVGALGVAGCLRSDPTTEGAPRPALVAHRGCAGENPENTVGALEAAAPVADAVEVDVRRCETGELVVFHDETLDRLTTGTGRLDRTPCGTVTGLEVGDSGESIPTLREVFEAATPDVGLVLDLKKRGLAGDVLAPHAGCDHELLLSSFHSPVLEEVRATDPAAPTARVVRESRTNRLLRPVVPGAPSRLYLPENVESLIERTVALGCEAIHPRYELCLQTDLVERAHAADLRVEPWTITTRRVFEALGAVGVDGVISDVCDGLLDRP
jgi:glycerophosphoryl diester phosphodiesterase